MYYRAGLFWAVEGAIALGYPEVSKRGKYMKFVSVLYIWLNIFLTRIVYGSSSELAGPFSGEPLCWVSISELFLENTTV